MADDSGRMLIALTIGGLLGILGQVSRAIAGFKTMNDWADAAGNSAQDLFVLNRLVISLIIGGAAGIAAVVGLRPEQVVFTPEVILGIAAAGYVGADFIEAFANRVSLASAQPSRAIDTTQPKATNEPPVVSSQIAQLRSDITDLRDVVQKASVPAAAIAADALSVVTPAVVKMMFPDTPLGSITRNLPAVMAGMGWAELTDRDMILMALSTIRCETEGFIPIDEGVSKYNTRVHPFDIYEPGTPVGQRLGNTQLGDGARFKGRGYVQLTGRSNYTHIGPQVSADLVLHPDTANQSDVAGKILGQFLKSSETVIRRALASKDLAAARKAVNGGSHGLDKFIDAYNRGQTNLPIWTVTAAPKAA